MKRIILYGCTLFLLYFILIHIIEHNNCKNYAKLANTKYRYSFIHNECKMPHMAL